MQRSGDEPRPEPVLAFVGGLVPDDPRFHGPAFNRAGMMFQEGLLAGLAAAGLPPDAVFVVEPLPAGAAQQAVLRPCRPLYIAPRPAAPAVAIPEHPSTQMADRRCRGGHRHHHLELATPSTIASSALPKPDHAPGALHAAGGAG